MELENQREDDTFLIEPNRPVYSLNESVHRRESVYEPPSPSKANNSSGFSPYYAQSVLSQVDMMKPRASVVFNKKRQIQAAKQQPKKEQLKFKLTGLEQLGIVFYNLIEPLLLGILIATALQIVELPSTCYLLISFAFIFFTMLTDSSSRIKTKRALSFLLAGLAPVFSLLKFWVYYTFTPCSNFQSISWLKPLFGIFPGRWVHTFICDFIVVPVAILLVWHYSDQLKQLEAKKNHQGSLKYQDQIKLLHFVFGEHQQVFFAVAIVLFFMDSLIYLTIVQLIILVILMQILYKWTFMQLIHKKTQEYTLRAIQLITYVFLTISYYFQYAIVLSNFQEKNVNLFRVFGLQNEDPKSPYHTRQIVHKIVLSFAIVVAETYFVCKRIFDEKSVSKRDTARDQINVVFSSDESGLKESQGTNSVKASVGELIYSIRISLVLWLCRILCFTTVYMYHDWQSVILLIWLFHSTLFRDKETFVKITTLVYFPLMILIFLFMFTVNIYGLIDYEKWAQTPYVVFSANTKDPNPKFPDFIVISKTVNMYRYGFYKFQEPHIELTFNLIFLISVAYYIRLNQSLQRSCEPSMTILRKLSPLLSDWVNLAIIKSQEVIISYVVVFSLSAMDIYHNFVLFWYIWGVLYPQKMSKTVLLVSYYAAFFIIIKYIYTLVPEFNGHSAECFTIQKSYLCNQTERVMYTFGFDSYYNPLTQREYFRYIPPYFDWIFVVAAFIQLRRQQAIGTDKSVIDSLIADSTQSIAEKMPRFYSFYVFYESMFYMIVTTGSFATFLLILTLLEGNILNLISFQLFLFMLLVYLLKGTAALYKYYRILPFYQAFVLVSLIICQFVTQCVNIYPSVAEWLQSIDERNKLIFYFVGYYQYPDAARIWLLFVPYIILFFGTCYVNSEISSKVNYEADDLQLPIKPKDLQIGETEKFISLSSINNEEVINQQRHYVQEVEKVYFNMKYQDSYKILKLKFLWPFFTALSLYFDVIMNVGILAFSIYYSISFIWLVFLIVYAIQTWLMQVNHRTYRKNVFNSFLSSQQGKDDMYTNSKQEARQIKLLNQTNNKKKEADLMVQQVIESLQEQSNSEKRLLITDQQAHLEYRQYKDGIYKVTLSKRKFSWLLNYLLLFITFFFLYLAMFIDLPKSLQVISEEQQRLILFIFYFLGFFKQTQQPDVNTDKSQFFDSEFPFFVLLLLLTVEKISHLWLENKCDTTKEKTDKYKTIQDTYEQCQEWKEKFSEQKEVVKTDKSVPGRLSQRLDEPDKIEPEERQTFNPSSLNQTQSQKDNQAELNGYLSIKSRIQFDAACRVLMEEIIVLLCLISLIYKQNILSFLIYFVVLFYTFQRFRSRKAISLCKYTILFVFLVQYVLAVLNMSSYGNQKWPTQILVDNVYPNQQFYYFNIPICFALSANTVNVGQSATPVKSVDLKTLSFYGIDLESQSLNGLWIDFTVTVLIYFYLNAFNCWLVAIPHKIVYSERTKELVEQYQKQSSRDLEQDWKAVHAELKGEVFFNKLLLQLVETISLNFSLLLVTFILLINVFQTNLLSFGYLISALILIYMNISFFKDTQSQDAQIRVLRYFLLPYLLLDIFTQLFATLPIQKLPDWGIWIQTIGIARVWTFQPSDIYLGEDVAIFEFLSPQIGYLFLKAIAYFLISLQLWIVQSVTFQEFSLKLMVSNLENQNKIGLGMAYRFNNFKNKQIMKQAQNYDTLDKMLKHVKSLIKRRDKLYKIETSEKQVPKNTEDLPLEIFEDNNQIPIIDQQFEDQFEKQQVIIDFPAQFKTEVKQEFAKRMKALSIGHKIYMWLRRNYVQDLLFRYSDAHLADMIKQFAKGRTCIKTTLEIGVMVETKQDWLKAKLEELETKLKEGDISEEELENFQIFRRKTLASIVLKPWERFDKDNYKSFTHLLSLYLVMFSKIISSYSHLFSYFFMLLATIQNGGLIYMPYPALLFGRALLEEDRPGKIFWYIVINYTNFILLVQFTAQLSLWQSQFQVTGQEIKTYLDSINFGLIYIPKEDYDNFWQILWQFIPEIGITVSTLLLIQKETLAGLFDVSLNEYESFTNGLQRQAAIIMEHSEQAKQNYHTLEVLQTTKEKLQFDQSLTRKRFLSEWDLREQDEISKRNLISNSRESSNDIYAQLAKDPIEVDYTVLRKRSKSLAAYVSSQSFKRTNVLQKVWSNVSNSVEGVLWDNKYFDRLFPRIKQQKPGKDFYVGIAGVQVIICFYLVIFYNQMTAIKSSIAEEYASTQFKGNMVLALFVMIGIMVVDRILYSNWSFMSRQAAARKLDTDAPLISNENSSDGKSTRSGEKVQRSKSVAGPSDFESERDFKEISETEQRAFQDILTPQIRQKTFSAVFRFYFLWAVLILVHWYLFFALVNEPKSCKSVPFCNKFSGNGYLVALYILFCIYFTLAASQIRTGLPELRKGGFMLGQYNSFGQYIFEGWYEIPFLFELRTVIDWTFTPTALDVFQSIKLAQVQADLYVARCENKSYREHELGAKQPVLKKIAIGFSLLMLILVLIAGPMLLFSTLNPVSSTNPVTGGYLEFYIQVQDTSSTSVQIPIFSTRELIQNQTLSQSAYDAMNLGNLNYDTSQYYYYQNQAVQFSPVSDTVWMVSPPKKTFLSQSLIDARDGTDPEKTVTAFFSATFQRPALSTKPAQFIFEYPLNTTTTEVLDSLIIQTTDCTAAATVNTTFPPTSIQITLGLNTDTFASDVTPQQGQPDYNGYFQAGFTLLFDCNPTSPSDSYWNLTQIFNSAYVNGTDASSIYNQEIQIFNQTGGSVGFGFFVFNQNVLPNYLAKYASSVLVFYAGVIYLIASQFRAAFVPFSYQIFIIDAPYTEDILSICQCIYIYRVQRSHKNEEELYMILIDIMRSPEMIKSLCGSSLKKKLD